MARRDINRSFHIACRSPRPAFSLLGWPLLLLLCMAGPAASDETTERWTAATLPTTDLYPAYAADPQRVGFGVQWQSFAHTTIPDAGDSRVGLRAGGRFGILRMHPPGEEGRGWQISLEGGFNAQFDVDHSLDNIGWDGRYGLVITSATSSHWAFKLGVLHDSAHVGDEYMERTGRQRIGYTRHEVAAAASWFPDKGVRMYLEAGRGYEFSNKELQQPGRIQFGLEHESAGGWYGAADFSATEERDWRLDRSLQLGLATHRSGRTWRFGVEWYDGRPPLGEFFQYTEKYVSLGLWVDI